eukprot:jgi/Mesen1/7768/ME000408S06882
MLSLKSPLKLGIEKPSNGSYCVSPLREQTQKRPSYSGGRASNAQRNVESPSPSLNGRSPYYHPSRTRSREVIDSPVVRKRWFSSCFFRTLLAVVAAIFVLGTLMQGSLMLENTDLEEYERKTKGWNQDVEVKHTKTAAMPGLHSNTSTGNIHGLSFLELSLASLPAGLRLRSNKAAWDMDRHRGKTRRPTLAVVCQHLMQGPESIFLLTVANGLKALGYAMEVLSPRGGSVQRAWEELGATVKIFPISNATERAYRAVDPGNFLVLPGSPAWVLAAERYSQSHALPDVRASWADRPAVLSGWQRPQRVVTVVGSPRVYRKLWREHAFAMRALASALAAGRPRGRRSLSERLGRREGLFPGPGAAAGGASAGASAGASRGAGDAGAGDAGAGAGAGADVKLLVLGHGSSASSYPPALQTMAAYLGLPNSTVQHVGIDEDAMGAIWAADAVVYTSFQEEAELPAHLVHAMTLGKLVVFPNLRGIAEEVGGSSGRMGLLYPPGDEQALASVLRLALEGQVSAERASELGLLARATALGIGARRVTLGIAQLLEHLVHVGGDVAPPKTVAELAGGWGENPPRWTSTWAWQGGARLSSGSSFDGRAGQGTGVLEGEYALRAGGRLGAGSGGGVGAEELSADEGEASGDVRGSGEGEEGGGDELTRRSMAEDQERSTFDADGAGRPALKEEGTGSEQQQQQRRQQQQQRVLNFPKSSSTATDDRDGGRAQTETGDEGEGDNATGVRADAHSDADAAGRLLPLLLQRPAEDLGVEAQGLIDVVAAEEEQWVLKTRALAEGYGHSKVLLMEEMDLYEGETRQDKQQAAEEALQVLEEDEVCCCTGLAPPPLLLPLALALAFTPPPLASTSPFLSLFRSVSPFLSLLTLIRIEQNPPPSLPPPRGQFLAGR